MNVLLSWFCNAGEFCYRNTPGEIEWWELCSASSHVHTSSLFLNTMVGPLSPVLVLTPSHEFGTRESYMSSWTYLEIQPHLEKKRGYIGRKRPSSSRHHFTERSFTIRELYGMKGFWGINNSVTSGKWLGVRCTLLDDKQLQPRSVKSQWDTPAHLLFTSGNGLRSSIYSCVLRGAGQQCLSAIADDTEWDTTGELVFKQGPQSEW